MEIAQLRYFQLLVETLNFTHAAERLGLTQSTLSRSIAKLEEELGLPVFERQGRKLSLTDAGRMLQLRSAAILKLVDEAKAEIRDDGQTGRLRVGSIPTIAPYLLPELLTSFSAKFPQAALLVQEDVTENLIQQVSHGEVDLALLALPVDQHYLQSEPLFDEELFLVLPAGHPLASRKHPVLEDVRDYPFVLLGASHCLSEQIVSFCRERSMQPVSIETTSQLTTILELVALGHGISMVPAMARVLDQDSRRVYRTFARPGPTRTIGMIWNPYRYQSRLLESLKQHVRKLYGGSRKKG